MKMASCRLSARHFVGIITSLVFMSGYNFCCCESTVIVLDIFKHQLMRFPDRSADFGPEIPSRGLWGHLVYAEPNDACSPIKPPPVLPPHNNNATAWIALIVRYPCHFDEKVLNAQNAGYDGVIVYNNGSEDLIPMHGNSGLDIQIPSVFVAQSSGNMLQQFDKKLNVTIVLYTTSEPLTFVYFVILGSIGGLGILLGFCIVFVNYLCHRARKRMSLLSKRKLKKLPVHKFKTGDRFDTCAICLDEYVDGDKLRVLPCGHAYHCKCIDPWLTEKMNTCPLCKEVVGQRSRKVEVATPEEIRPLLLSDAENDEETVTGGHINPGIEIIAEVHSSAPVPAFRSYGSVDESAATSPPIFPAASAILVDDDDFLPDDRAVHFSIESPKSQPRVSGNPIGNSIVAIDDGDGVVFGAAPNVAPNVSRNRLV